MSSYSLPFVMVALSAALVACSDAASSSPADADTSTVGAPNKPSSSANDVPAPSPPHAKDAGADAAPPSASAAPASPEWVTGTFDWSEWQGGDLYADFLNLPANGAGYEVTQILRPLIRYNAGDQVTTTYFQWTSDGNTVHAGTKLFTFDAKTPNCRLVLMAGHVYTHTPKTGTCPVQMPALTDLEKARVGYWQWSEAGNNSYSDAYVRFRIDADRYLHVEYQPHVGSYDDVSKYQQVWTDYYLTDPDGTLHGTNPSGMEEFTQTLLNADGGALQFCDDQGANCTVLHK